MAVARRLGAGPRRRAVQADVVRHVAIEPLVLTLCRCLGEEELRGAKLLHAHPPVPRVDDSLELRDFPDRQVAVRHRVLPGVGRRPLAFDGQRLDRQNLLAAAQRIRGIDDGLQFRRRPVARTDGQGDQQDGRSELHGSSLTQGRTKGKMRGYENRESPARARRVVVGRPHGCRTTTPAGTDIAAALRLRLRAARRRRRQPVPAHARGDGDDGHVSGLLPRRAPARDAHLGRRRGTRRRHPGRGGRRRIEALSAGPAEQGRTLRDHDPDTAVAAGRGGLRAGRRHLCRAVALPLRPHGERKSVRRLDVARAAGGARCDVLGEAARSPAAVDLLGAAEQQNDLRSERRTTTCSATARSC